MRCADQFSRRTLAFMAWCEALAETQTQAMLQCDGVSPSIRRRTSTLDCKRDEAESARGLDAIQNSRSYGPAVS